MDLHVAVEQLLLTSTDSPTGDQGWFAAEVSRRFAIVILGPALEVLQVVADFVRIVPFAALSLAQQRCARLSLLRDFLILGYAGRSQLLCGLDLPPQRGQGAPVCLRRRG